MAYQSVETLRFIPESYLPSVPYIPLHFKAQRKTLDASAFSFEIDEQGLTSIIRLQSEDGIMIPFIDLSKYDSETKDWLWFDPTNEFPYRYNKTTNSLTNLYPSEYTDSLTVDSTLLFNKDTIRLEATVSVDDVDTTTFYKFSPLILTVNNKAYNDLSDYANFKPSDRLNKVNTTVPEFYYDFDSRIYTNQSFVGIDPSRIKIHFYSVSDNTVQVKCRLSSNSSTNPHYTPRVNSFIVKLKGQSLRA